MKIVPDLFVPHCRFESVRSVLWSGFCLVFCVMGIKQKKTEVN